MGKPISASEVNKFCYCPAQWYYERTYGAKRLNEWRRERNEAMGWEAPPGESAFERGKIFHTNYTRRYARRLALRRLIVAAGLAAVFFAVIWYVYF